MKASRTIDDFATLADYHHYICLHRRDRSRCSFACTTEGVKSVWRGCDADRKKSTVAVLCRYIRARASEGCDRPHSLLLSFRTFPISPAMPCQLTHSLLPPEQPLVELPVCLHHHRRRRRRRRVRELLLAPKVLRRLHRRRSVAAFSGALLQNMKC